MLPTLTLVLARTAQNKALFSSLLVPLLFVVAVCRLAVVVCRSRPPLEPAYKTYFERNIKAFYLFDRREL